MTYTLHDTSVCCLLFCSDLKIGDFLKQNNILNAYVIKSPSKNNAMSLGISTKVVKGFNFQTRFLSFLVPTNFIHLFLVRYLAFLSPKKD